MTEKLIEEKYVTDNDRKIDPSNRIRFQEIPESRTFKNLQLWDISLITNVWS